MFFVAVFRLSGVHISKIPGQLLYRMGVVSHILLQCSSLVIGFTLGILFAAMPSQ